METAGWTRRELLAKGSAFSIALAELMTLPLSAFAGDTEEEETLIPFLNVPRAKPGQLDWEGLDSWFTPQEQVFTVAHYGTPTIDPDKYTLEITGLVDKPAKLTLADLKSMPRQDRVMTLECSGNGAFPGFTGAVYNSRWTGTPLAPLLQTAGIRPTAKEVAFIGYDEGKETIVHQKKDVSFPVPFGRSLALEDALDPLLLLAYEREGEPLTPGNGFPVRLITPGRYGIANVKWLRRIEVLDRRYMGRFMARDYVTLRARKVGDQEVFEQTSVNEMNLKSVIARVARVKRSGSRDLVRIHGAAWDDHSDHIKGVEVKIDDGPWQSATVDRQRTAPYSWLFFSFDWPQWTEGKHTLVSRALGTDGNIQPAASEDEIALKKTYWEAYAQWPREIEIAAS
ncbi:MAG: molybdopterin-dependent oxidoreductase [Planctomycetota bacterium]